MRNRLIRVLLSLGTIAISGGGLSAPRGLVAQSPRPSGVIDGVVSDTGLVSLGDATVAVLATSLRVTTGANGRFRIVAVPAGQYILTVHRLGYVPMSSAVQIGAGDTLRLSFALSRIATPLDTVVVTAKRAIDRLSGFEDRRRLGFGGKFITTDEIEHRSAIFVSDLLRMIPSVRIVETTRSGEVAYNNRGTHCLFQVFVDEVLLPTPTDLHLLPRPSDIAGIELYFGPASIPLQYKTGNSGCGVILIWTKGG